MVVTEDFGPDGSATDEKGLAPSASSKVPPGFSDVTLPCH